MKKLFRVTYSKLVYYAPVEIEADNEEEALQIIQEKSESGELYEDYTEDDSVEIDDLGEIDIDNSGEQGE